MDLTWIEVVDSGVKIGLGAAISAIAGYAVLKRSHAAEFQKELRQRRWKMLEEVGQTVQKAYQTHLVHVEALAVLETLDEATPQDLRTRSQETLSSIGTRLTQLIESLSTAEANLLLLGEHDAHEKCRFFGESIMMYLAEITDQLAGTKHDTPQYAHDPEKWRGQIFKCLSDIYKRI